MNNLVTLSVGSLRCFLKNFFVVNLISFKNLLKKIEPLSIGNGTSPKILKMTPKSRNPHPKSRNFTQRMKIVSKSSKNYTCAFKINENINKRIFKKREKNEKQKTKKKPKKNKTKKGFFFFYFLTFLIARILGAQRPIRIRTSKSVYSASYTTRYSKFKSCWFHTWECVISIMRYENLWALLCYAYAIVFCVPRYTMLFFSEPVVSLSYDA